MHPKSFVSNFWGALQNNEPGLLQHHPMSRTREGLIYGIYIMD